MLLLRAIQPLKSYWFLVREEAFAVVNKALGSSPEAEVLAGDIANLVDMFCCLFDLKRGALRMTVLDRAMCPRFHVDRVPCRLVTTYQGIATEWLPHNVADRSKLGTGNMGKPMSYQAYLNIFLIFNSSNQVMWV